MTELQKALISKMNDCDEEINCDDKSNNGQIAYHDDNWEVIEEIQPDQEEDHLQDFSHEQVEEVNKKVT